MATKKQYVIDVGDEIPDFMLDSQVGKINFKPNMEGRWSLLLTFGMAYDPVATTDIGMMAKLADEFDARNVSIFAIGCDTVVNYRKWIKDIQEVQGAKVTFPLMSDTTFTVLSQFGCARETPPHGEIKLTSCGAFLIDIDKRVRSSLKYSTSVGRNFYEILRLYDAIQTSTNFRVVCPANWGQGQECLIHPMVEQGSDEEKSFRFQPIKPWFRLTPCPDDS